MTTWSELYRYRDGYLDLLDQVETLTVEKKELLASLKEMVHLHQHGRTPEGDPCYHERAVTAIAKAEGGAV